MVPHYFQYPTGPHRVVTISLAIPWSVLYTPGTTLQLLTCTSQSGRLSHQRPLPLAALSLFPASTQTPVRPSLRQRSQGKAAHGLASCSPQGRRSSPPRRTGPRRTGAVLSMAVLFVVRTPSFVNERKQIGKMDKHLTSNY